MDHSENIIATDRFSWSRTAQIGRYYFPMLRNQILLFTALGFTMSLATRVMPITSVTGFLMVIMSLASTLMIWWGSGIFASNSRECEVMLPALWSEKFMFVLLYTFIAIPAMVCVPEYIVAIVAELISPSGIPLFDAADGNIYIAGNSLGISSADTLVPLSTCFYVVFRSAKSTFTRAAVWSTVAILIIGMAVGVIAAWMITARGVDKLSGADSEQLRQLVGRDWIDWGANIFSCLYALLMIALTARSIKNMQV